MLLQLIKKTPILLCAGAMLVFTSCNSNEAESFDDGNSMETVNDAQRSMPNIDGSGVQNSGDGVQNNAIQNPTPSANGAANLNPPHGEPGHDCAVPVGQPLTSNSGAGVTNPTINAPTFNAPKSNSTAKLNPAHGEPGHDCAVPVGQPLN